MAPAQEPLFFLAVSSFSVEEHEVLDHLVEHRAWSKAAYDAGVIMFSGRQDPPVGGAIGFRASGHREADDFLKSDPYVIAGVASYELIAVQPTGFPWRREDFDSFMKGSAEAFQAPHAG